MLLVVLAIAIAIIPAAIVRAIGEAPHAPSSPSARRSRSSRSPRRGGPRFAIDDPGAAPAQLATDLEGSMPPGPGVFVANRAPTWLALDYAGDDRRRRARISRSCRRCPPIKPTRSSRRRASRRARSPLPIPPRSVVSIVERAIPRGRGFQLVGDMPDRGDARPAARDATRPRSARSKPRCSRSNARATKLRAVGSMPPPARVGLADAIRCRRSRGARRDDADEASARRCSACSRSTTGPAARGCSTCSATTSRGSPASRCPPSPPRRRCRASCTRSGARSSSASVTPDDPAIAALGPRAVAATNADRSKELRGSGSELIPRAEKKPPADLGEVTGGTRAGGRGGQGDLLARVEHKLRDAVRSCWRLSSATSDSLHARYQAASTMQRRGVTRESRAVRTRRERHTERSRTVRPGSSSISSVSHWHLDCTLYGNDLRASLRDDQCTRSRCADEACGTLRLLLRGPA